MDSSGEALVGNTPPSTKTQKRWKRIKTEIEKEEKAHAGGSFAQDLTKRNKEQMMNIKGVFKQEDDHHEHNQFVLPPNPQRIIWDLKNPHTYEFSFGWNKTTFDNIGNVNQLNKIFKAYKYNNLLNEYDKIKEQIINRHWDKESPIEQIFVPAQELYDALQAFETETYTAIPRGDTSPVQITPEGVFLFHGYEHKVEFSSHVTQFIYNEATPEECRKSDTEDAFNFALTYENTTSPPAFGVMSNNVFKMTQQIGSELKTSPEEAAVKNIFSRDFNEIKDSYEFTRHIAHTLNSNLEAKDLHTRIAKFIQEMYKVGKEIKRARWLNFIP